MKNWKSKLHPKTCHLKCACVSVEGADKAISGDSKLEDPIWLISGSAHCQTKRFNCNSNHIAVRAAWSCPSIFNDTVLEHLRPSSESIKATARKVQVDHLRSENWDSRILIQAHWERPDGSRGSQKLLSQPFDASSHQLSQRVHPHEGLRHCQLNELHSFNKVQNATAGCNAPLPAIPGSHPVKTRITQNAPPQSLKSERVPPSLLSMAPVGSKCGESGEMGRPALAALVRLRTVLAQGCQYLGSLCVVHQSAVCCRHYYASAIVFWLLCIITTTIVLIAATAFRSNHKRD